MSKSTAVTKWDEKLKASADGYGETESSVALGQFISFRAGQMTFHGSPIEDNKLDTIVLDAVIENAYYEGEFDADNPVSPLCYAFGRDGKVMKPHDQSPKKQHEQCQGCWANEFNSAERGRGKACKNVRRLALIAVPGKLTVDAILKSEIAYAKVPVTSVPAWAAHVKGIKEVLKKPPFGVVTTIGCVPDQKSQFKVTFKIREEIKDQRLLEALFKRNEEARATIEFPYPVFEDTGAPKRGKGKGSGKGGAQQRRKY